MSATSSVDFSLWIGRRETVTDDLSPATAQAAAAVFDEDVGLYRAGVAVPPLWHWFYFLVKAPQSQLGHDGHPRRESSSFMPPIPLPRRMFAGSRLQWYRPLVLGFEARREAEILKIELKSGRSGALAFVTVAYRYYQSETSQAMGQYATTSSRSADLHLCLEEEQDIVYREPGPPLRPPAVAGDITFPTGAWTRTVVPDTRLLFRFSALTFNAHRIHYDRPYATEEEGYPGLVVHGPLTAMLLLQLVREHTTQAISKFRFRSQAPLLEPAPIQLVATTAAGEVELQAIGPGAQTAMIATATLV